MLNSLSTHTIIHKPTGFGGGIVPEFWQCKESVGIDKDHGFVGEDTIIDRNASARYRSREY